MLPIALNMSLQLLAVGNLLYSFDILHFAYVDE